MPPPPFIAPALAQTASRYDVEILFAIESGSRAWGLASTDSDYDVRFVYRHPRDWYLSLHPGRDMIGPHIERDGELDLAGWNVRKFLHHLSNSNSNVLEWLASPIVYHTTDTFLHDCRRLADVYFRPRKAIAHYLGIAHGARQAGLDTDDRWNLKKFCYWMRPILAATYIVRHGRRPPITMDGLLPLIDDGELTALILELMSLKHTVREDYRTRVDPRLMTYFTELRVRATAACNGMDKDVRRSGEADTFFRQTIGYP